MTDSTSRRRLVAVLVVLAAAAASASGQTVTSVPIDSLARATAEAQGLPSLVVGVTVNGRRQVVGVGAFDSTGAAPDAHTLYEIGSISKVLTSLALADAVVRGETTLDAPVADLLPDSVAVGAHPDGPIRLRDLATHTAGLPKLATNAFVGADIFDPYAAYGPDLLYAFLRDVTPASGPGTAYGYSNAGAGLLGFALARRAGTDYATLVRQRVLAPLGMDETYTVVPDSLAGRFATGHGPSGAPAPHWTFQEPTVGAGGWRSSAADLLTLAEAAIDPSATPLADALALSLEPRFDIGDGREIGLGWHLAPRGGFAWHNGGTGGFVSFVGAVPEAGIGVVVLTNRQSEVDGFAVDLLRRLVEARR